jgi:nicotinamide mononucleotide adenylyltransferase
MQNWDKKIHVQSSLQSSPEQYALFIGRWQPLHDGHKALFQQALDAKKRVWIAIRNVETTESNPFDAEQVLENIETAYADLIAAGKVIVSIIPDICSIEFGRGVGYDIIEHVPPTQVAEISATRVREQMRKEGKL